MSTRCPLCRSGILGAIDRELTYGTESIASEAYQCSACRETVMDAAQVARLRDVIRMRKLATTEPEVDEILQRLMLKTE
jgi:hypothetical protein